MNAIPLAIALSLADHIAVEQLGHEDYRVRVQADDWLRCRGWSARQALARGKRAPDVEVRHRAGLLWEEALAVECQRLEPLPEIDGAWWDIDQRQYDEGQDVPTALLYGRLVPYLDRVGRTPYPWPSYYQATRDWVRDELASGLTADDLLPLIQFMRRKDANFLRIP